ncbi:MAG: outer membrane beta-barrel protein [Candidatus Kapaibacterium sp.]
MKKLLVALCLAIFISTPIFAQNDDPRNAFSVIVNFNFPTGAFGDFWGNGLGLVAEYERLITNEFSAGASIGYLFWMPETEPLSAEIRFSDIPIQLFIKYYFPSTGNFTPYFIIEGGLHNTASTTTYGEYSHSDDGEDLGLAPGFGVLMPVGSGVMVNACAKYTTIFTEDNNTTHFGFNAGVTIPF